MAHFACSIQPASRVDTAELAMAKALVVDAGGHHAMMAQARQLLSAMGMRTRVVGTMEQALKMCREWQPLLIVVPAGQGGSRLLWQLQRAGLLADEAQRPAVLALMPRADAHMILWMLVQGADECLSWPFDEQLLATTLHRILTVPRHASQTSLRHAC